MSKWQPIETAPKDGTIFLAYLPKGRPRSWYPGIAEGASDHVWVCTWDSYSDPQSGLFPRWIQPYNKMESGSQPSYSLDPTHWMPLPEPPK